MINDLRREQQRQYLLYQLQLEKEKQLQQVIDFWAIYFALQDLRDRLTINNKLILTFKEYPHGRQP